MNICAKEGEGGDEQQGLANRRKAADDDPVDRVVERNNQVLHQRGFDPEPIQKDCVKSQLLHPFSAIADNDDDS